MPIPRLSRPTALLAVLLLPACDKSPAPTESSAESGPAVISPLESSGAAQPFEIAEAFFELNATDHDMGLQILVDAEGWKQVSLTDPEGRRVFGIQSDNALAEIGITELRFESEEPEPSEVRSRFPAGRYTFRGQTVEGENLVSTVNLSQRMLPAPTMTPRNGQLVDPRNTVVRWEAPGADMVEVIIEQDELGHVFDVTLSSSTTRLTLPPQFLRSGREYKIEILSIGENGNRTITESTFRTR
ncbi:MAG TPA: hypothetical protein VFZ87_11015 [Gemmatimonadales bacterium]